MLVALLLLAAADARVLAVLEFRSRLDKERVDTGYLTDQVRAAALEAGPSLRVITRENLLTLLRASGKDLAECEGECEVDTGRRVGADLVISGELLKFGTSYKLNMRLHDTREGTLLSAATAAGQTFDELDHSLQPAVQKLLGPLAGAPRQQPAAAAPEQKRAMLTLQNNEGGTFSFTVDHPGGSSRCPKPLAEGELCYLSPVEAGDATVRATGTEAFQTRIKIPDGGGKFVTYKMGKGALVFGLIALGVGVPLTLVGLKTGLGSGSDPNTAGVAEVTIGAVLVGSSLISAIVWLASDKGYQLLPAPASRY